MKCRLWFLIALKNDRDFKPKIAMNSTVMRKIAQKNVLPVGFISDWYKRVWQQFSSYPDPQSLIRGDESRVLLTDISLESGTGATLSISINDN